MSTKEQIQAELENLPEEDLQELLHIIQGFAKARTQPAAQKPSLLVKLKQVKIDAPEDFAANLDLYLSGEKQVGSSQDVH